MSYYEHIYIASQSLNNKDLSDLHQKIEDLIKKNKGKRRKFRISSKRRKQIMKRKNIKKTKKNNNSNLMLFQKATTKFTRDCPLSGKDAPVINYKNLKLLQKYISETGKMLPSRITSVCYAKQKELSNEIKKARILALLPFVAD